MNEKTRIQIEKMKKQTIGVEIEMNSISRDKAARVAAEYFGTGRYADTALTNGYRTWSAWDNDGREWKFQKDVSIAGPDSEKCEMVTPILRYEDIPFLQELVRQLRHAGARSSASQNCGVHVHIGANGHTPQTLRNLANIMASHERLLIDAINVSESRIHTYCKTVDQNFLRELNRRKPRTMAQLADIWYGSQNADYGRSHTILNRPIFTSVYMPEISTGNKIMLFGDLSYYWISDRQGRTFQRLNELYAAKGQVGFRVFQRVDGKLILPEAVKTLVMG